VAFVPDDFFSTSECVDLFRLEIPAFHSGKELVDEQNQVPVIIDEQ